MTPTAQKAVGVGYELTFMRVFNAPRALLWKVWTDPFHLAQWWGPHGFTNPVCEFEAKEGGRIRIDMKGPDGTVYPMTGTVNELDPPKHLIFTGFAIEGEDGSPGLETLNTLAFEEEGGKTTLTLRVVVVRAEPNALIALSGMEEGWSQSLERLEQHIAAI
ncbi:MAG: SRPBCC family protein [Phyllobacterium sp.]